MKNVVEKAQKECSQSLQGGHFRWGCSRTMSFEGDVERVLCISSESVPGCCGWSRENGVRGIGDSSHRTLWVTPRPGLCLLPRGREVIFGWP